MLLPVRTGVMRRTSGRLVQTLSIDHKYRAGTGLANPLLLRWLTQTPLQCLSPSGRSPLRLMLGLENPGPSRPAPRDGSGAKDSTRSLRADMRL